MTNELCVCKVYEVNSKLFVTVLYGFLTITNFFLIVTIKDISTVHFEWIIAPNIEMVE